jgi:hypothetical protein
LLSAIKKFAKREGTEEVPQWEGEGIERRRRVTAALPPLPPAIEGRGEMHEEEGWVSMI